MPRRPQNGHLFGRYLSEINMVNLANCERGILCSVSLRRAAKVGGGSSEPPLCQSFQRSLNNYTDANALRRCNITFDDNMDEQ